MPQNRRRKKKLSRKKRNFRGAKDFSLAQISYNTTSEFAIQKDSMLLRFAGNPQYVGAMRWMLHGCLACSSFVSLLFIYPKLGRDYENIAYFFASFVPERFIPPDMYIPGVLTMPLLLMLVVGFTGIGYRLGAKPPEVKSGEKTPPFTERLIEFFLFLAICLFLGFYKHKSKYPGVSFKEMTSDVFFIAFIIILVLGLIYYVFSRHYHSTQLLIFVMNSAVAVGFVLFLIGLIVISLFECFQYALKN